MKFPISSSLRHCCAFPRLIPSSPKTFHSSRFKLGHVVVLLFVSVVLISCTEEKASEKREFVDGNIFAYEKGAPIPDKLVSQIEKDFVAAYKVAKPDTTLSDVEIAIGIPRKLMELDVEFQEKNSGTLLHNTRFGLPPGGGAIDFADFVNEGKGIFFAKMKPRLDAYDLDVTSLKVFYVSNSKKFQAHGKTFGSGCGKFFDITAFYNQVMMTTGYELAVADRLYLGQILGTFYFMAVDLKGVYVSGVSFIDTRYPEYHCLAPQVGEAYQ